MARRTAIARTPPWAKWIERTNAIYYPADKYIFPLSEEWRRARRGRLTASERAITIHDRRPSAWNRLMDQLDAELLPTYQWEEKSAPALSWGREHEPGALANITLSEGHDIVDPGLIFHKKYPFVAATPDGVIGTDGGPVSVQIKCPYNPDNHLRLLYGGQSALKPVYYAQTQWELWVAGASAIKFYSYDPRQPAATQLVRLDLPADEKMLDTFDQNVQEFAELFSQGKRLAEGKLSALGIPDF